MIDQWLGARAGNQWLCKVELDTGRPIKQPLNRLYPLPQPSSTLFEFGAITQSCPLPGPVGESAAGTQPTKRPRLAVTARVPSPGGDSDGYGSSMASSGEDDEALAYAKRATRLGNSRALRRARRKHRDLSASPSGDSRDEVEEGEESAAREGSSTSKGAASEPTDKSQSSTIEASSNGEGAEKQGCKMDQQQQHWPGAQRCIMGITKERFIHLNGMQCTLVSFKATTDGGRWQVKTFEADKDGNSDFIIRPCSLIEVTDKPKVKTEIKEEAVEEEMMEKVKLEQNLEQKPAEKTPAFPEVGASCVARYLAQQAVEKVSDMLKKGNANISSYDYKSLFGSNLQAFKRYNTWYTGKIVHYSEPMGPNGSLLSVPDELNKMVTIEFDDGEVQDMLLAFVYPPTADLPGKPILHVWDPEIDCWR